MLSQEDLTCPITHEIFKDPVMASDGNCYERSAINNWYSLHKTSPITREKLQNSFITPVYIKNALDEFIKKFPDKKKDQYTILHTFCIKEVDTFIIKKQYNKLLDITEFDLSKFGNLDVFLKECTDDKIVIHVIDNSLDLEQFITNLKLIHFVCKFSNCNILKHLIQKNVDINAVTVNTVWRPVHFLAKYGTKEMLNCLLEKDSLIIDHIHIIFKKLYKNKRIRSNCRKQLNCKICSLYCKCVENKNNS